MLEVKQVDAGYGFLQILREVSLHVDAGEFVALVGPNGAGKSTTLKTIAGLMAPARGEVRLAGKIISGLPANVVSRLGISYISETLNLFTNMSIYENLLLGAYIVPDKAEQQASIDFVYQLFPRLRARHKQLAGTLSGGERKMLAIARGIMSKPKLLLVDEPSLGLAPKLTMDVFRALESLRGGGMTILLVEQNVNTTLHITDRAYVLEHGVMVLEGKSRELLENEHVKRAYLGV